MHFKFAVMAADEKDSACQGVSCRFCPLETTPLRRLLDCGGVFTKNAERR